MLINYYADIIWQIRLKESESMNNMPKSEEAWKELEKNLAQLELMVKNKIESIKALKETAQNSIKKIDNLVASLNEAIK